MEIKYRVHPDTSLYCLVKNIPLDILGEVVVDDTVPVGVVEGEFVRLILWEKKGKIFRNCGYYRFFGYFVKSGFWAKDRVNHCKRWIEGFYARLP